MTTENQLKMISSELIKSGNNKKKVDKIGLYNAFERWVIAHRERSRLGELSRTRLLYVVTTLARIARIYRDTYQSGDLVFENDSYDVIAPSRPSLFKK